MTFLTCPKLFQRVINMKPPLTGLSCRLNSRHIKQRRPASAVKKEDSLQTWHKLFGTNYNNLSNVSNKLRSLILELHFSPLYNQTCHIVQMVFKANMFGRIRLPVLSMKHGNAILNGTKSREVKPMSAPWGHVLSLQSFNNSKPFFPELCIAFF